MKPYGPVGRRVAGVLGFLGAPPRSTVDGLVNAYFLRWQATMDKEAADRWLHCELLRRVRPF